MSAAVCGSKRSFMDDIETTPPQASKKLRCSSNSPPRCSPPSAPLRQLAATFPLLDFQVLFFFLRYDVVFISFSVFIPSDICLVSEKILNWLMRVFICFIGNGNEGSEFRNRTEDFFFGFICFFIILKNGIVIVLLMFRRLGLCRVAIVVFGRLFFRVSFSLLECYIYWFWFGFYFFCWNWVGFVCLIGEKILNLLRWAFIRKLILLPCYVTKWWYSLEDSFVFFLLVIESLVLCFHNGDVGMICFVNCTRWIGHGYFCTKWICLLRMDLLEVI